MYAKKVNASFDVWYRNYRYLSIFALFIVFTNPAFSNEGRDETFNSVSSEATNRMVLVKGGTFQLGFCYESVNAIPVTLNDFYVGKYEVTQREYQEVMGNNPSEFIGELLPVDNISWIEAIIYCNKLSIMHGFNPVYHINNSYNPQ